MSAELVHLYFIRLTLVSSQQIDKRISGKYPVDHLESLTKALPRVFIFQWKALKKY